MTLTTWAAALILAAGADAAPPAATSAAPSAAAAAAPLQKDPQAMAVLKKMSDKLQKAKTFSFKSRSTVEVPVAGGVLALFFTDSAVSVKRPDKLAVTMTGDSPEFRFAYDGKSMTAYTPATNAWATTAAPPTIDALLQAAMDKAGIFFPYDEVLASDPYAVFTRDLVHVFLLGQASFGGHKVDHVALATPSMEVQAWIDVKSSLPRAVSVIYLDLPRTPHFYVEYADWKLDPKLPASTFALAIPKGATQIEFHAPPTGAAK